MATRDKERSKKIAAEFIKSGLTTMKPATGSDLLSELEHKALEKRAFGHFKQIVGQYEAKGEVEKWDGFLLAAAPATGRALGVAVDERTGDVDLIEVSAKVGMEIKTSGDLEVIATEVKGVTEAARTYVVTSPSEWLKKVLLKRFESIPYLSRLALHHRDVQVEISNPKFLYKGESLLLAVIIAIVKAAIGRSDSDGYVYSADVDMQGSLTTVGRIQDKASFVMSSGNYGLVISRRDSYEIPAHIRDQHPSRIIDFDTLAELFDYLGLQEHEPTTVDLYEKYQTAAKRRFFGPVQSIVFLSALSIACGLGLLVYTAGNFFALADLMMAWHLRGEDTDIFRIAQVVKFTLATAIAGWVSAQTLSIIASATALDKRIKILLKLKRIRKYKMTQFLVLIVVLCITYNVHVFVREFYIRPSTFQKYERIEYLIYNNDIPKSFTRNVPNYRYDRFKTLFASQDSSDLEEAVKVGLKIRPEDPQFKTTFIDLSAILMDRVNNTDYARKALSNYVQYTEVILNRQDARQSIADTIDSARDLMNRYGLEHTFNQEQKFGGFIEDILLQLELER